MYPSALPSPVLTSIDERKLMCQLAISKYLTSKLVKTSMKMHFDQTKRDIRLCENRTKTEIYFLKEASSKALVRALGT